MIVNAELVESSLSRLNFKPRQESERLGETNRSRWLTTEQKENRLRYLYSQIADPERARAALERIVEGNDLVSINYLAKGLNAARPICRIQLRVSSGDVVGYATGFLVGPGVLMTNHHVFPSIGDSFHSIVDFDYELDDDGREKEAVHFALEPDRLFHNNEELDFAVVAVALRSIDGAHELPDWGWLPLSAEPGKADPGEYLTIIQHPGGELKQVCVRENKLLKYMERTVWYMTDTTGGSSGSPVFNRFWQVVAIHHSGVPRQDSKGNWLTKDGRIWNESMDESLVDWIANEGVRISVIVDDLKDRLGNHPLMKGVLEAYATASPIPREARHNGNGHGKLTRMPLPTNGMNFWGEQDGDIASLVVPLRIPLDIVRKSFAPNAGGAATGAAPAPVKTLPGAVPATLIEKVAINQKTLGSRPGYKAAFLGPGKLSVPLPMLSAALQRDVAKLKNSTETELKYFNYSVVMNRRRRFAFFSAVNIDGKLRRDVGKREGDSWLRDPRISADAQVGDEFYAKQKLDEAREQNPFDRGHLVRRLDATWGTSEAAAKEHGDDTFHFTNCTPQFFKFNQGAKLWLGLEEFVLDQLEVDKRKACVINGPVFDGPEAEEGELPGPDAPRKADPKFKGVPVPKFFWKLMVIEQNGRLAASAFLLSQQDLVLGINRIEEKLTHAEAKMFQISIADLTKFTKLNFGKLGQADTKEAVRKTKPLRIESLSDVRF